MDPLNPVLARRTALVAGLSGAGALALAACGGGSSTPADTATGTAAATTPATSGAGSETTSGAGSGANSSKAQTSQESSAPTTSAAAAADAIVALDSVEVGGSVNATVDGKPVVVARPNAKTVVCHTAICTHQGCTVKASGAQLDCPCHGSVFNAFTGAVENPPAQSPLAAISVKVVDGQVVPA